MSITLEQHIQRIRKLSDDLLKADAPVKLAAGSTLAEFSERVFIRGESVSGRKFQYNDDTPLYVNPSKTFGDTSDLRPPTGKTGRTKFASTGKPHVTTWVESYKELRGKVEREDAFVNWVAQGNLKSEIESGRVNGIGMQPVKVGDGDYKIGVASEENSGKLEGLMKKYPGVFKLSEEERKTYAKTFDKEFLRLIKERL